MYSSSSLVGLRVVLEEDDLEFLDDEVLRLLEEELERLLFLPAFAWAFLLGL